MLDLHYRVTEKLINVFYFFLNNDTATAFVINLATSEPSQLICSCNSFQGSLIAYECCREM